MTKCVLKIIPLLFIWIFCNLSYGQNQKVYQFTDKDGLASNEVWDIAKDSSGYLWIATANGVSKYNGSRFKNYFKSHGLAGNLTRALAFDDKENIWVGCYGDGISKIDKFEQVNSFVINDSLTNNSIRKLHYSIKYQLLFVGTDYGLYIFRDSIFEKIIIPKHEGLKQSILAIEESDSSLFFSVHGKGEHVGLYEIYDLDRTNFTYSINKLKHTAHFAITIVNDTLYSNMDNEIFKYDIANNFFTDTTLCHNEFLPWDMEYDDNNKIWMAGFGEHVSIGGVAFLDLNTNLVHYNALNLPSLSYSTIFYDKPSNTFWVGSNTDGLFLIEQSPFKKTTFNNLGILKDVYKYNDHDYILLTEHGVFKLNKDNGKTELLVDNKTLFNKIYHYRDSLYRSYLADPTNLHLRLAQRFDVESVTSRFEIIKNKIYIVTNKGWISFPDLNNYLPFDFGVFNTINDTLSFYVRKYQGIRFYHQKDDLYLIKDSYYSSTDVPYHINCISKIDTTFILISEKRIWNMVNNNFQEVNINAHGIDTRLNDVINDGENFWCSTSTGQLIKINKHKSETIDTVIQFSPNQNLNLKWIILNNKDFLLGTNTGLYILDGDSLKNNEVKIRYFFNKFNGYDDYSMINTRLYKNQVYMHSRNTIFEYNSGYKSYSKAKLIVTNINADNTRLEITDGKIQSKLSSFIENFSIQFELVKLPNSSNISYSYRINDGQWISGNKVDLYKPKHNNYKVTLKAFDNESQRHYTKEIHFTIPTPFYKTYLFVVLVLIVSILFVYLLVNYRIELVKKREQEKRKLMQESINLQIRSLQIQMNPHFLFNSLNSVQGSILKEDMEQALTHISKLSKLIRNNLTNVSKNFISIGEEIEFLKEYAAIEQIRLGDKLNVHFSCDNAILKYKIPPLILQPIIENSIKHGIRYIQDKGIISVQFEQNNENIIISIIDNGIGLSKLKQSPLKTAEGTGKGLKLIEERFTYLNTKFHADSFSFEIDNYIEFQDIKGAIAKLTIPLMH